MTHTPKPETIEDHTTKAVDPATICSGVLTRLYSHRGMMAPHQKERHGGKLLMDCIPVIEVCLRALQWRADLPDCRGWWWFRANVKAEPKIIQVYPNMDGDLIITGGGNFDWLESLFPEMEWAGPLIAPTSSPNS